MNKDKTLYLLDAYALIFRAYYAFIRNPRINSKRLNTSAIFGFTNSLVEILTKENPAHIAVVFDPSGPTFRNDIYPDYKKNREETPEDIKLSIPYIKKIIKGFNIPVIQIEGYEADDVIGTLANMAKKSDYQIYMMTPDKDYCQLVDKNVLIYKPKKAGADIEILGIEEVKKKFGIMRPEQVIDILALMGDASDNVPGAPGIGPKTAEKLINQFGSVEDVISNSSHLKGKQKQIIEEYKEQILLSKKLVTIKTDISIDLEPKELKREEMNKQELSEIFRDLEFSTIFKRIIGDNNNKVLQGTIFDNLIEKPAKNDNFSNNNHFATIKTAKHKYELVENEEERQKLIKELSQLNEFCFDTETTGLETLNAEIIGLAFSFKSTEAYYVKMPEDRENTKKVLLAFKQLFENKNIAKIGQNIKYDILMLKSYDLSVNGNLFDTLIAHYLIQPELKHNLNFISEQYLNYTPVSIETLIGNKGKDQLDMRSVSINELVEYAGEDADITYQLKHKLEEELKERSLWELAYKIEMPLIKVLVDMELSGFNLDVESLNEYGKKLRQEAEIIEKEIIEMAGESFNISSPKQLGIILFEKLKIDENAKKTRTKQYSTNEEILIRLQDKHPIIGKILDYRSVKKLLSTYVEALPKLINQHTKKIHTSYNQAVTATGRLSSNKPNLQNIPIREERGREIRKAFIPSKKENFILSADYSQIELRLMAHMSGDNQMINAFLNDEDIHTSTAAKIYNIPLDAVTKEMRRKAKTANFGIIYGISVYGLSQRLNIPRKEADELIKGYFDNYPKVKEYMEKSIRLGRENGYVQTIFGRKRYLKDINSRNGVVRGIAERNAINAPIQGSAADIIKMAMINIHRKLTDHNYMAKMILQVHDELIFDVPYSELETIKQLVVEEMENTVQLQIPLTVETGTGKNWLEAH